MPSSIELLGVCVDTAAGEPILRDVTLRIAAGETVALIGRSGAGKTTALRSMNGLVVPSRGEVRVDGVSLAATDLIALRRRCGYILQGSGLFPHRTVYENVATVPRLLGWPEARTRDAAAEVLGRVGLPFERFGGRKPRSLSGGEQQRVGIARALVAQPALLLCDEPFGALDPIVRRELQETFVAFRDGVTIVFVTHDLAEAMRIAERIVMFDGGAIVADAPSRAFVQLDDPRVRAFVNAAVLPGAA
ncbi:MAG TPA: ATP-binding cassette domain-containing protein [Thermoanaerobaculia bacterium]|nr:ATP-binding cassette domain-containing protein [Thermoanaerobaculia bacterium]